jgi:putative flippase GtrA
MIRKLIRKYPFLAQFIKFVMVGLMNTAIDFAVLNLLMWQTGIYEGKWMFLLNAISFTVAVSNSYFWNKYWTFRAKGPAIEPAQMGQFLIVSLIGVAINSSIVYMFTTNITPFFGLGRELWANAAKMLATGLTLIWNFIGYKFIVFNKKNKIRD